MIGINIIFGFFLIVGFLLTFAMIFGKNDKDLQNHDH